MTTVVGETTRTAGKEGMMNDDDGDDDDDDGCDYDSDDDLFPAEGAPALSGQPCKGGCRLGARSQASP